MRKLLCLNLFLSILYPFDAICAELDMGLTTIIAATNVQRMLAILEMESSRPYEDRQNLPSAAAKAAKIALNNEISPSVEASLAIIWELIEKGAFDDANRAITNLGNTLIIPPAIKNYDDKNLWELCLNYKKQLTHGCFESSGYIMERQMHRQWLEMVKNKHDVSEKITIIHHASKTQKIVVARLQQDLQFLGFKVSIVDGATDTFVFALKMAVSDYKWIVLINEKLKQNSGVNKFYKERRAHPELINLFLFLDQSSIQFSGEYLKKEIITLGNYEHILNRFIPVILNIHPNQFKKSLKNEPAPPLENDISVLFPLYAQPQELQFIQDNQYELELDELRRENARLKAHVDRDENDRSCSVCLTNNPVMVFLDCHHLCTCEDCARPLKNCPICRADIMQAIKIYQS